MVPDLGGKSAAAASGHHDGREQHPQFPQHGDADHVDRIDAGTELLQLQRAHEGDDDTDQEGEQADDRQSVEARGLEMMEGRPPVESPGTDYDSGDRNDAQPEETEQFPYPDADANGPPADQGQLGARTAGAPRPGLVGGGRLGVGHAAQQPPIPFVHPGDGIRRRYGADQQLRARAVQCGQGAGVDLMDRAAGQPRPLEPPRQEADLGQPPYAADTQAVLVLQIEPGERPLAGRGCGSFCHAACPAGHRQGDHIADAAAPERDISCRPGGTHAIFALQQ